MPVSKDPRARLRAWLCSGTAPQPGDAGDAEALRAAAAGQGLVGLLSSAAERETWPEEAWSTLHDGRRAAWASGVRRLATASRVLDRLEAHGLRALPLKGAALAERLYDSVADRPMQDVDLLALDDWQASVAVLRSAGLVDSEHADHAWAFTDPETNVTVELHHSLTSCPGLFPVDTAGLWCRSRVAAGQVRRAPSDEDLLVQLSLHAAFQHGLVLSLVQWLDFRRLLDRGAIDVRRVIESTGAARGGVAVAAALEVAAAVVAAPVPPALREVLATHVPRRFAAWLHRRLQEPLECVVPAEPRVVRVRWALASGQRLRLVTRTLAPRVPGPREPLLRVLWAATLRTGRLLNRWGRPRAWWRTRAAAAPPSRVSHV